jgi:hypothetical protein
MYLNVQLFLSRCHGNFENKHKSSSEIEKITNEGKIILNKEMSNGENFPASGVKMIQG